jgi:hypothetical protein
LSNISRKSDLSQVQRNLKDVSYIHLKGVFMKKFLPFIFITSLQVFAAPDIIPAPVKHLYLPDGFDSNDTVEVVVTGAFPNVCYSRNEVKVNIQDDVIDIFVSAISHEKSLPASKCLEMEVPFKEVVHIGNLQGGEYKVNVNNNSQFALTDSFRISESSSNSVDDYIYAAIEYVENRGKTDYVLHGWRYSNCIDINKIQVVSNNKDTLSILPVMKQLTDFCPMKMMPTQYSVKLDFSTIKMKSPLLHVRTMDGKSVNTIINLEERR